VIFYRFGSGRTRKAEDEFDGTGGVVAAGRWHTKGRRRVVYGATSEALALLEKLVHRPLSVPSVYPLYHADIPDSLVQPLMETDLPHDWRSIYPSESTRQIGDQWLESKKSLVLLVPSTLITGGDGTRNCLLNPNHPQFSKITLSGPTLVPVDPRLVLGSPP
jgi:RES domain-containing protein